MVAKVRCLLIVVHCLWLTFFSIDLHGQATANYPPITIQKTSIKVGQLLKEITRQAGLDFSFNSRVVDTEAIIAFEVQEASLEETLMLLSKKIAVEYVIIEGQIVLKAASTSDGESKSYFTLSGFIVDKASGESLINASVLVKGTTKGAFTNEFGYYTLSLEAGNYSMVYSYIGFEAQEIELNLQEASQRDIALQTSSIDLPAIIVAPPLENILHKKQLGHMALSPNLLTNLPEFGGEAGLIKGLQALPGIKMHSDGSAFFYTRGGERDQNLVIIDDAPIYNPSHLMGFYSVVIPDFTKSIDVYKSDMPAAIGDRLSSIVSIRTNDGNLNRVSVSGALNPLVNRLTLEAPIAKQRSSVFLSYRRSNYEWIWWMINPAANVDISFQDFHFKWNFKINDKNRLFYTIIQSQDNFVSLATPAAGLRSGNLATSLRWNHIFSPKLFSNTILSTGNYVSTLFLTPNFWRSTLGMLSIKSDFTHYVSPVYTAKFGVEAQGYFIAPGELALDTTIAILPEVTPNYSRKMVAYYQGAADLSAKLKLHAGLRMIHWSNLGPKTYYSFDESYEVMDTIEVGRGVYNNYFTIDPRISLQYSVDSISQLKLSYGVYHQYLQLISNSISPFTSLEFWLPASPNIRPQVASQWALSYLRYFEPLKMELSVAAYYKLSKNQIDYEGHATTYLNPFIESELRFGTAHAYGIEFLLKKDFGRLNGWLSYTYSRVFRTMPDLNEGRPYRAFQDRPHELSMVLNYRLSKRLFCSAYWTSYSGSTFTSPVGFYTFNGQTAPIYGEKNNDRLPAYHRLDVSLKLILNKKETSRYKHSVTFSIYNALAHRNVYAVKFNKLSTGGFSPSVATNVLANHQLSPSHLDLIRFFPSLTYKFKL